MFWLYILYDLDVRLQTLIVIVDDSVHASIYCIHLVGRKSRHSYLISSVQVEIQGLKSKPELKPGSAAQVLNVV